MSPDADRVPGSDTEEGAADGAQQVERSVQDPPRNAPDQAVPSSVQGSAPQSVNPGQLPWVRSLRAWLALQRDARGDACRLHQLVSHWKGVWLACGEAGIWSVAQSEAGSWALLSARRLEGAVVRIFEQQGRWWVELRTVVRPLDMDSGGLAGQAPAAWGSEVVGSGDAVAGAPGREMGTGPRQNSFGRYDAGGARAAERQPQTRVARGLVTAVDAGEVIIDLGRGDGLRMGDRVALSRGTELTDPDPLVGVVARVETHQARIELGLNEQAEVGQEAQQTLQLPTSSRYRPSRPGGVWIHEVAVRPFIQTEGSGGGVGVSLGLTYRAESPYYLAAHVVNASWAHGESGDEFSDRGRIPGSTFGSHGVVEGGYDGPLFGLGLALGAQQVNDPGFGLPAGTGTSLGLPVRFGANDGLNLRVRLGGVLFFKEFEWGEFHTRAQLPISRRTWLAATGGAGKEGFGYGGLGARRLMAGNGGAGTWFAEAFLGGAGVWREDGQCEERSGTFDCGTEALSFGGPMLALGLEYRR